MLFKNFVKFLIKINFFKVNCVYCAESQLHPKLARGESYSCGYKPYRCDLCKYSTTTKGNLSIHMQSDKHLHALQEISSNNYCKENYILIITFFFIIFSNTQQFNNI